MKFLDDRPLEQIVSQAWHAIDPVYRRAFAIVALINVLAFGFEMTNLTLHHDDVSQLFIQSDILGHYLGRFGTGWLHYYTQNAYFMPFLQMAQGIALMSAYGLLVAHFWGLRRTLDVVLIAAIVCVFPFMGQVFQYNTTMVTYAVAHLVAAAAVIVSTRATVGAVLAATLLYVAAFSIYQSVLANAATLFGFWALGRLLFADERNGFFSLAMLRSAIAALVAVTAAGLIYMAIVARMDIPFDSYQGASSAFSLGDGLNLGHALREILWGSRSFYFWPEHYFPAYLKKPQLVLLALAGLCCAWVARGIIAKVVALLVFGLTLFAPRLLQLLHADGNYHNLTLTAYALVVAGAVMLVHRSAPMALRNASATLASFLVAGYVVQSNWISTVNHLNMQAHVATVTQILARVRALPDADWDGRTAVVVGRYPMYSDYPYRRATGVATDFINAKHMQDLARLLRDEITFVPADATMADALGFAAGRPAWPHPQSVGVVDGMAVIVLSSDAAALSGRPLREPGF